MIYGNPQIKVEKDVANRIGIRTLILSLLWQPKDWAPGNDLQASTPDTPPVPGGLMLIGRETIQSGGAIRTSWTYEGIEGDGRSVTFKTRATTNDYEFHPGFSQRSIQLHPDFFKLRDTYNGFVENESVIWQDTISPKNSTTAGLGGRQSKDTSNPMFGIQDYFEVEGTYTCRYAATSLVGLTSGVGQIFTQGLPGIAPSYDDRDWLKCPIIYQRRGPVFEITETYWLSVDGGWPKPVYKTANSGGDMTTTALTLSGLPAGDFSQLGQ